MPGVAPGRVTQALARPVEAGVGAFIAAAVVGGRAGLEPRREHFAATARCQSARTSRAIARSRPPTGSAGRRGIGEAAGVERFRVGIVADRRLEDALDAEPDRARAGVARASLAATLGRIEGGQQSATCRTRPRSVRRPVRVSRPRSDDVSETRAGSATARRTRSGAGDGDLP